MIERLLLMTNILKYLTLIFFISFTPGVAYAQTGSTAPFFGLDQCLWFEEEDGSPTNLICGKMKVSNGSLTDNGDGSFSLSTGAGGGGGGGDTTAEYVTLSATSGLTNERVLTGGTNINIVDAGAGSTITVNLDDAITLASTLTVNGPTDINSIVDIGTISTTSAWDISSKVAALYLMNDNLATTTVLDSSGNSLNGISVQNTEDIASKEFMGGTQGNIGAFSFNGTSDHIDLAAHTNIIPSGSTKFGVFAMISITGISADLGNSVIFFESTSASNGHTKINFNVDKVTGNLEVGYRDSPSGGFIQCGDSTTNVFGYNQLVGVQIDTDANLAYYYIDGKFDNTQSCSGGSIATGVAAGDKGIGGYPTSVNNKGYFKGEMAWLLVVDDMLTNDEIYRLRNFGIGTEESSGERSNFDTIISGLTRFEDRTLFDRTTNMIRNRENEVVLYLDGRGYGISESSLYPSASVLKVDLDTGTGRGIEVNPSGTTKGIEINSSSSKTAFKINSTNGAAGIDISGTTNQLAPLAKISGLNYSGQGQLYVDGDGFGTGDAFVYINSDSTSNAGLAFERDGTTEWVIQNIDDDTDTLEFDASGVTVGTLTQAGTLTITSDVVVGSNSVCQSDGTNCPASSEKGGWHIGISGGGSAITAGEIGQKYFAPRSCTIDSYTIACDQSGTINVAVYKDTYANYPPTSADIITASASINVTASIKNTDSTLTGWSKSVVEGDWLIFDVINSATVEECTIDLSCDD